jgi:hypothetical protein
MIDDKCLLTLEREREEFVSTGSHHIVVQMSGGFLHTTTRRIDDYFTIIDTIQTLLASGGHSIETGRHFWRMSSGVSFLLSFV